MPIYEITTKDEDAKRLVKADSSAQAIRHCAEGLFSARVITRVDEAAPLFDQGVRLETAGEPAPEPKVEPEPKPEGAAVEAEPPVEPKPDPEQAPARKAGGKAE